MNLGQEPLGWILPLMIGGLTGVLLQRSRYCTMGALTDLFLFGSWRRLRVWLLAMAVAMFALQFMEMIGWFNLEISSTVAIYSL